MTLSSVRMSGNSGCRSPPGSAPRPRAAAAVRRPPTTAAAASGRTSRSASSRKPIWSHRLDPLHTGHRRQPFREPLPFGLDLDAKPPPSTCRPSSAHRAHQHDVARVEQRDPVAHALHPLEQVRRQQHADAVMLERADDVQQARSSPAGRDRRSARRGWRSAHPSSGFRQGRAAGACRARRCATRLSATSASPTRASAAAIRSSRSPRPKPDQARRVAQIVGGGEVVVEADLIGQIANPALDRERLAHRIMAEHARLAVRDVAQAEQHQDGGGLAGAVGAEQAEDLAALRPRTRRRSPRPSRCSAW